MVKLSDIARELGVSTATISNALSGKGRMKEETRQQIRNTASAMGYVLHQSPQDKQKQLLIITEANEVTFSAEIVCGISKSALSDETCVALYDFSILRSGMGRETTAAQLRPLIDRCLAHHPVKPDALIYISQYPRPLPGLLDSLDIPTVEIYCQNAGGAVSINYDNQQGAYQAVSHLIETGCQSIAMLSGPVDNIAVSDRLFGYQRALLDHGLAFHPKLVWIGNWEIDSGFALTTQLLKSSTPPDAIFAQNDTMAIGALRAARELSIRIPDQLSIVGFDNTQFAGWTLPELTSVAPPFEAMGAAAYSAAMQLARGGTPEAAKLLLPCSLAMRNTTKHLSNHIASLS